MGFTVWFDRESLMSRGRTFHQEIKDAIRTEVDRIVYVGGPKAKASPFVREEWQLGLEFDHVVVTPILRIGDYPEIPGELSLLHCEDFRDDAKYDASLMKLITGLREPNPKLGALFAVPSLPAHFLARQDLMSRVREALLVDLQTPQVITSTEAHVGVQGMGGIGKSVIAAALARDREVRQSYPDGIMWISFGQNLAQDELISRLRQLVRHLGGEATFQSLQEGQSVMRELLQKKAVLLVMDDVWRANDAKEFDHFGPRCRMLVTTRDKRILDTLHGELVPVSLFTEAEALQLLADAVGLEIPALPAEARVVVDECGLLPLAIALSGGMAKAGHSWQDIVDALREADLEWPENREALNETHRSIWNAMKASYDALPDIEKPRFAELAVFATDVAVPEAAVHTFWNYTGQLNARDCTKLLISLAERSLIRLDQRANSDAGIQRCISLHDLLHDFAERVSGDCVAVHGALVKAYQLSCEGRWCDCVEDGYIGRHLPLHVASAHMWHELTSILHDVRLSYYRRWVSQGDASIGILCLEAFLKHTVPGTEPHVVALGQVARLFAQRGDVANAETMLRRACGQSSGHRRARAVALHELGSICLKTHRRSEARSLYWRALAISLIGGASQFDEIAANLMALATTYKLDYHLRWSVCITRAALALSSKVADESHIMAAHRLLESLNRDLGKFVKAHKHLLAATSMAQSGDFPVEQILCNLASGWHHYTRAALGCDSPVEAQAAFTLALEQSTKRSMPAQGAEARLGLIWCNLLRKDGVSAEHLLDEYERLCAGIEHYSLSAMSKLAAAHVAHALGRTHALASYSQACDFAQRRGELGCEADARVGAGIVLWHSGQRSEAEEYFVSAILCASHCSPTRKLLVHLSVENGKGRSTFTPL